MYENSEVPIISFQYVEADKVMEQHKLNCRECELERQSQAIDFSRNEAGSSLKAEQSNRISPIHDTVTSHKSTMISVGGVVSNPSRTGDPAQDMLDLFLGPLLKKPLEEKKQFEFVTENTKYVREFKNQCQNDVVEEMVPLTKKKSSLKDKVAVFLD